MDASFSSDGVEIAYVDTALENPEHSVRRPVLLTHGFASNLRVNWVDTGWVKSLTDAGYRVIAFDHRGHGRSEKLYDPELYGAPIFAEDARRLLDHLQIARADVIGFSMGARVTAFLTLAHPDRVNTATFSGLGINMVIGLPGARSIADALLEEDPKQITHPTAKSFRVFAEATGSDLKALAACILSSRAKISRELVATIERPVLVAVGTEDAIGGSAADLAALIPGAQAFAIEGRDHMKAVGDRTHKAAVLSFLAEAGKRS